MNELTKFHKFLGVESARVTPLGSTPASPVPAVVRLSLGQERDRGTCVSFRCHLASPAENTGEIHGHPVSGPWPSADLWESWENTTLANSQNTLQDKTIGSVTLRELVCLWNYALKFQWSIHFFKCPRRYISRWIRWNKLVLPLIRRPLISSAQFYLLSSKASAFQGHLNFSRSTSTIQHHYLNTK